MCKKCRDINIAVILEGPPLRSCCKAYKNPHYIVIDTNVVLHQVILQIQVPPGFYTNDELIMIITMVQQIDVLEADVLCNVIVLQTVLDEVKHRSSSIYKRLKDIVNNPLRKFYVFVNEHHKYGELKNVLLKRNVVKSQFPTALENYSFFLRR